MVIALFALLTQEGRKTYALTKRVRKLEMQVSPQSYSPWDLEAAGLNPADYGWQMSGPISLGDLGPGESVTIPSHIDLKTGKVTVDTNGIVHHPKQ